MRFKSVCFVLCLFLVLWASLFLSPSLSTSASLFFCHCLPFPPHPTLFTYLPFLNLTLVSLRLILWFCLFGTRKVSVRHASPECSIPRMASLYTNIWNSGKFLCSLVCQFSTTSLHFCRAEILFYAPSSFVFLAVLI